MTFQVLERHTDGKHQWAVVGCACDLSNEDDDLVQLIVTEIRDSYGESEVLRLAELETDGSDEGLFDLGPIRAAFRLGLPDPNSEGHKPPQLTNYRSEATEMVARRALAAIHAVGFHVAPQIGKVNPNQPILGFDGWGIMGDDDSNFALVLVQVKATDEDVTPPSVTRELVEECARVPRNPGPICRALAVLVMHVQSPPIRRALIRMLELLGRSHMPQLVVAPVIVRGQTTAQGGDLDPLRHSATDFAPAIGRGVVLSLGVDLNAFGRTVMSRARAA
jgi:hypothetical protein